MEKEIWTIDDIIKDYENQGLVGRSKVDFLNNIKDFILKNTRYVQWSTISVEEQEKVIKELKQRIEEKMKDKDFGSNPIYTPKKYLKWEDLKFTYDEQKIKVKLNGEDYTVVYCLTSTYYHRRGYEYVGILKDNDLVIYSIYSDDNFVYQYKKFFNDLHLEVVE